ncbi:MAG: (d)CMP kinase [Magnetococcales bacterium]|nr:(d)CMP kinase [Magnetococcales bacterium]
MKSRLVVALDGPAGAGKGTVCRGVAARCGLLYLDTGAIYRAVALSSLEHGVEKDNVEALAEIARTMPFEFRLDGNGAWKAWLGERDVSQSLREEDVGQRASQVSALQPVRAALLEFQRGYGAGVDVVLDGRDVGTVVFPDADLKIFLTASLEERANRRVRELHQRGEPANLTRIREDMAQRDARDAGRKHAPLLPADDAIVVDTSSMTPEQAVDSVVQLVEEKR